MDLFTISFYASLCALIGLVAPRFRRWYARLIFGAVLGMAAAALLPQIRALAGG